jgi:antitoxin (DNA-binding transcriptional repressor) of toxin-antitoxin stability system
MNLMQAYSLEEAQNHLDDLVSAAMQGKLIYIQLTDQQAVQLVPVVTTKKARKAGSARNLITIAPDFDAPLSDFDEYMG